MFVMLMSTTWESVARKDDLDKRRVATGGSTL